MQSENLDLNSASADNASDMNGSGHALPLEREGENYLDMVLRKEIHQWFKNNSPQENNPRITEPDNFGANGRTSGVINLGYNGQ